MADNKRRQPSTRSPFAGCTIILVGIAAMVFLVAFVIWNLFKLDAEISKFTSPEAEPVPVADLVERMETYNGLRARIELFKDAAAEGRDAELRLDAEDINLAIAAYDEFKELRRTFAVEEIADGRMRVAISFPLRGKPLSDEMRYLNGTMLAVPKLSGDEIILEVSEVLVPGAEVPEGFIGQLSPYRITQRYLEDATLGPWLKRLTDLSVAGDGHLVLTVNAAQAAEEQLPEDLTPYRNRFLLATGLSAVVFVLIVGIIALAARRRARRRRPEGPLDPGQL